MPVLVPTLDFFRSPGISYKIAAPGSTGDDVLGILHCRSRRPTGGRKRLVEVFFMKRTFLTMVFALAAVPFVWAQSGSTSGSGQSSSGQTQPNTQSTSGQSSTRSRGSSDRSTGRNTRGMNDTNTANGSSATNRGKHKKRGRHHRATGQSGIGASGTAGTPPSSNPPPQP